jgi:hypothetical protein
LSTTRRRRFTDAPERRSRRTHDRRGDQPRSSPARPRATLAFKSTGLTPETFSDDDHALSTIIASPGFFAFFVAACAGAAGMLTLSTARSGALIGVLISVATIPAAANIGIAAAYQDWDSWRRSIGQLSVNLCAILIDGTATLHVQRLLYVRRRRRHLGERAPSAPPATATRQPSSEPSR